MMLYMLRHGNAGGKGANPPLSADGRLMASRSASVILSVQDGLDAVLSSPLRRALESATTLSKAAGCPLSVLESLEPEGSEVDVLHLLASLPPDSSIAIVTHLPQIRRLVCALVADFQPVSLHVDAGGIMCVEVTASGGTCTGRMLWFASGRMLSRLVPSASEGADDRGK